MHKQERYLKRCIQIGRNGFGTTRPNPAVGCVIVHDDKIIGEGFTSPYGGPHAEVNAVNSVTDKSLLNKATLYVILEPCSHYGKTPPCSDLIIKHNIPNVIIGCVDDNPEVAGRGIQKLKDAGCNVIVGVLEKECKMHHKRFFTFHNKKRPYIILKWAEAADGFIAPEEKSEQAPVWITNAYSRQLVHKWRAEEHAILVGTKTVLADNPSLTVRDWTGQNPMCVVLDKDLKLPKEMMVFKDKDNCIIIADKENNPLKPRDTKEDKWSIHPPLSHYGIEVNSNRIAFIDYTLSHKIAKQICDRLYEFNIQSIIIEGGAQTLQTFIDENLWDEARVFYGATTFKNGIKAPKFLNDILIKENFILKDKLKIFENN